MGVHSCKEKKKSLNLQLHYTPKTFAQNPAGFALQIDTLVLFHLGEGKQFEQPK